MDLSSEWAGQSSEDHRATVLLRQEHQTLLELFRMQHDPGAAPLGGRDALQAEIVALVELIGRIEREVFFPALPSEYTALVRSFAADYDNLSRCLASLRRAASNAARANHNGERLERLARDHLVHEQNLLFTAVEREHPDLNRRLYEQLVAARARFT
jgi:hypothetical protein